ncbi:MAG TPA: small ribosomal subunit Rsm22 family protein [Polyangia bacterium]
MIEPWIPRLLAVWRRLRGSAAGAPSLTAEERRDLVAGAQRLSHGLTRERELAGARYFEDPQLLGAYLLLWWPATYAQAASVLRELGGCAGRVLDVGSGPGPMALAALDAGFRPALAVDRSAAALAVAAALADAAGEKGAFATARWESPRPLPDGPFELVLAGHVLNELYGDDVAARAALVESMLARTAAGGFVVLIEPALRETSRALLALRDRLVAAGATVRAPCLYRGGCPALVRPTDWCHAERRWTPPPLVDELAHAAKLHRETLKMSYLVLQAPGAAWPPLPDGRLFRIVSEPLPQKGQYRYVGCGPEGRLPLVLAGKHLRDANRAFTALARGDVVSIDRLTARGDGLRLDDQSNVQKLAGPEDPVPPKK